MQLARSITTTQEVQKQEPKCPKGRKAYTVCVNDKCEHQAFSCKDANCCLKNNKTKCKVLKIEELEKIHQSCSGRLKQVFNETQKFFDEIIKIVQSQVSRFTNWYQKSQFISSVLSKNAFRDKSSLQMAKFVQNVNVYNQHFDEIGDHMKSWRNSFKDMFAQMRNILFERNKKKVSIQSTSAHKINIDLSKSLYIPSKIIWKESQRQALSAILSSLKPKNTVNLLYNAVEHDFSIKKFHQLCDGVSNTLVIIRNEKDKVYGGFTSQPWGRSKLEKFVSDPELKTFVFSINTKKRYSLKQNEKQYAIEWNNFFGPIFGRCNMIQVWDRANKQGSYWEHIPFSFKGQGQWTNEMYEEFLGVPQYQEYRLVDWQVFQLNLD